MNQTPGRGNLRAGRTVGTKQRVNNVKALSGRVGGPGRMATGSLGFIACQRNPRGLDNSDSDTLTVIL
jgi:hypothetical protein